MERSSGARYKFAVTGEDAFVLIRQFVRLNYNSLTPFTEDISDFANGELVSDYAVCFFPLCILSEADDVLPCSGRRDVEHVPVVVCSRHVFHGALREGSTCSRVKQCDTESRGIDQVALLGQYMCRNEVALTFLEGYFIVLKRSVRGGGVQAFTVTPSFEYREIALVAFIEFDSFGLDVSNRRRFTQVNAEFYISRRHTVNGNIIVGTGRFCCERLTRVSYRVSVIGRHRRTGQFAFVDLHSDIVHISLVVRMLAENFEGVTEVNSLFDNELIDFTNISELVDDIVLGDDVCLVGVEVDFLSLRRVGCDSSECKLIGILKVSLVSDIREEIERVGLSCRHVQRAIACRSVYSGQWCFIFADDAVDIAICIIGVEEHERLLVLCRLITICLSREGKASCDFRFFGVGEVTFVEVIECRDSGKGRFCSLGNLEGVVIGPIIRHYHIIVRTGIQIYCSAHRRSQIYEVATVTRVHKQLHIVVVDRCCRREGNHEVGFFSQGEVVAGICRPAGWA